MALDLDSLASARARIDSATHPVCFTPAELDALRTALEEHQLSRTTSQEVFDCDRASAIAKADLDEARRALIDAMTPSPLWSVRNEVVRDAINHFHTAFAAADVAREALRAAREKAYHYSGEIPF